MRDWIHQLLDLFFPPKCPFCGKVLDHAGICPACEKALPWTEEGAGLRELPGGLQCAAPLWYEGKVREGLLRFKFQGARAAAGPLGELVARCAAERFSGAFDVVTWVPVSRRRLRSRGYDQARLLAESACRLWEIRPEQLLQKITDNPAQSGLTEEAARRANVLGVYEAAEPERIQGYRILLVDDICTTGATLAECARTLRDAGAADVMCVCAALARRPEKKP
ncbi:MAG: ComF family protein [Dysosmobacter sp.]|uniref:ComF family protein n=1 Tax=Dysosmobacter sp. TaxID=2591382 RepID=UPI002848049D|nr:ComF family protein [Dysosmobacter sp.]MDR3982924.1 ComF family protein [Dysosmobacter sp.]